MIEFDIKIAQKSIWEILEKSIKNDKIGSAYLFSGPSGVGKEAMAIEFGAVINRDYYKDDEANASASYARFKNLQHELLKLIVPLPGSKSQKKDSDTLSSLSNADLDLLKENIRQKSINPFHKIAIPNATRIRINSIRDLRKSLYLKSDDIGRKIVLIFDAHLLSFGQAESGNALLKILEEPPTNTTLILVTDKKDQLLPTILSRCQQVDFPPLYPEMIKSILLKDNIDEKYAELYAGLAQGDMRRALKLSQNSASELLSQVQELAKTVTIEDGVKWRKFINDKTQLARKDLANFQYQIFLLQLWFKSTNLLRVGVIDELQRPELLDFMHKFNQQYPRADLQKINILLEETVDAIGKNLYMSLILTDLLININKHLK